MSAIHTLNIDTWTPEGTADNGTSLARELESGRVLYFPRLRFAFEKSEEKFLDPRWSNGSAKNISLSQDNGRVKGAAGSDHDQKELSDLVGRYRSYASRLVRTLLPKYSAGLRLGRTSYRPVLVQGRPASWRKDDSRLHVDAFPSRPTRGERIMRVFANVNPNGMPRTWRVGEPFGDMAKRLLPRVTDPFPGSGWLLYVVRATKTRRSRFDHIMLQLHDQMKRDMDYQHSAPQETFEFTPGSVWICFSDQTSHAAMSGQFMFEQTMHLPVEFLYEPERSPLRTLESLTGRPLV
jgi:hypothetical protein